MIVYADGFAMPQVELHEAEATLTILIERVAAGEEIIITRNGIAQARLAPVTRRAASPREPSGALEITYIADDFDEPDEEIIRLFEESKIFPDDESLP